MSIAGGYQILQEVFMNKLIKERNLCQFLSLPELNDQVNFSDRHLLVARRLRRKLSHFSLLLTIKRANVYQT